MEFTQLHEDLIGKEVVYKGKGDEEHRGKIVAAWLDNFENESRIHVAVMSHIGSHFIEGPLTIFRRA